MLSNSKKSKDQELTELEKYKEKILQLELRLAEKEKALYESQYCLQQVYDHMAISVAQLSLNFFIHGANRAYCRMLGYREEELIGKHLRDITHPDTLDENLRKQSQLAAGEINHYRIEIKLLHKNGSIVHGILDANLVRDPKGNPIYCIETLLDITDRKQTEEKLKKSESLLRRTEYLSKVGGWEYDLDEGIITWTDGVYQIYGLDKENHDPNNVKQDIQFYVPKDRKKIEQAFKNAVNKGESYDLELGFISAKGKHLWVRTVGVPVWEQDKIVKVIGNIMDITDRKFIKGQLHKREATIQSVFDAAPVGICIMKNRVYQRVNKEWSKSFGYPEEEIIGRTTRFLYESQEEYERVGKELYTDLLKKGTTSVRSKLKRNDGEFRDVDLIAKPLNPYNLEDGTVVVINDITDRKRAEDSLRESERKYKYLINTYPRFYCPG